MFGKHQFNEFIIELLGDVNKPTSIQVNGVLVNAWQLAEKICSPDFEHMPMSGVYAPTVTDVKLPVWHHWIYIRFREVLKTSPPAPAHSWWDSLRWREGSFAQDLMAMAPFLRDI